MINSVSRFGVNFKFAPVTAKTLSSLGDTCSQGTEELNSGILNLALSPQCGGKAQLMSSNCQSSWAFLFVVVV